MTWAFETAVRTLWQEARGEPAEGRRAVAHVILNRLKSGHWGKTLATVCLAPYQFSGWNMSDPNRMKAAALADDDPVLSACRTVLTNAQSEPDPTDGALYYYAPAAVKTPPPWAATMTLCGQFGAQLFFKEVPK